jgi:SAM-dependent methyltransferase
MFPDELQLYLCPKTGEKLNLESGADVRENEIIGGILSAPSGQRYPIRNGLPNFTYPEVLLTSDLMSRKEYDAASKDYDALQNVTFSILCQDETVFRKDMIGLLNLKRDSVVLETAAGTGLNLPYIIEKMNGRGHIFVQDISSGMLENCQPALSRKDSQEKIKIHRSIGNAAYLPLPDKYFDAALSFGGIGVFADKERAIKEMFRVVKPGGRIVFGDEGVAPWLRNSRYGKILMDNNHFYADEVPINLLPVEARDVSVRWVMGGGFYLVDMTVGEGEPPANFDFKIPGVRGGTLNTRYYGKLEGVTQETKELVKKAREKSGKSMHQWIDEVLRQAAEKEITKLER